MKPAVFFFLFVFASCTKKSCEKNNEGTITLNFATNSRHSISVVMNSPVTLIKDYPIPAGSATYSFTLGAGMRSTVIYGYDSAGNETHAENRVIEVKQCEETIENVSF